MLKVAVTEVPAPFQLTWVNVKPLHEVESVAPMKFEPEIVTVGVVPCAPLVGLTLVIVGVPDGGDAKAEMTMNA